MPDASRVVERVRDLIGSGRTVAVGMGNPDRADDGAGVLVVSRWKARLKKRAFIEPETPVETAVLNHLEDPDVDAFLFVDAADFGGRPGDIRWFGIEDASGIKPAWSTHKAPMELLMRLIASKNKQAFLLGIQAGSVELFGAMTGEVTQAVGVLSELKGGSHFPE